MQKSTSANYSAVRIIGKGNTKIKLIIIWKIFCKRTRGYPTNRRWFSGSTCRWCSEWDTFYAQRMKPQVLPCRRHSRNNNDNKFTRSDNSVVNSIRWTDFVHVWGTEFSRAFIFVSMYEKRADASDQSFQWLRQTFHYIKETFMAWDRKQIH